MLTKQNFIVFESCMLSLVQRMKNSTLLKILSKCKTTLINLIEYLFDFLLEELFLKICTLHPLSFA